MDPITQLEDALDTLLKVMASAIAYLSRKAGHKQVNPRIPLTVLGTTEALPDEELASNRDELVHDLVAQAKEVEARIGSLPTLDGDEEARVRTAPNDRPLASRRSRQNYTRQITTTATRSKKPVRVSTNPRRAPRPARYPPPAPVHRAPGRTAAARAFWITCLVEEPEQLISDAEGSGATCSARKSMENAPWMVPPGTTQNMEAIHTSALDGDAKAWHAGGAPLSPKFWAQVELPDMFLSNLFHQSDAGYQDDSLNEFSGSVSTASETDESADAFQDFMFSQVSDTSSPEHESLLDGVSHAHGSPSDAPLPFKPNSPMADMLGQWMPRPEQPQNAEHESMPGVVSMDHLFAPIFSMGAPPGGAAPAQQQQPQQPASPPAPAPAHDAPRPDEPALPGLLQMPTGSNANALTALARIREFSKHADADQATRAPAAFGSYAMRHAPSSSGSTASGQSPSDSGAVWSKKVAHNAIERRYRSNINDRIAGLRDVVPALREMRPRGGPRRRRRNKAEKEELVDGVAAATKMSKATVLSKATEYICYLKSREVQLDREVNALQMLVRSLEGGEELLAAWNAEVERMQRLHPPTDAAYGSGPPPAPFPDMDEADESENDEEDESAPSVDEERPSKMPRYMLGAFVGFSFLGGAADWTEGEDALALAPTHTRVLGASHQLLKRSSGAAAAHHLDHVPSHSLVLELLRAAALVAAAVLLVWSWVVRRQQKVKAQRTERAALLQDACAMPILMQTPMEHAHETHPARLDEAEAQYEALSDAVGTPSRTVALGAALLKQGIVAAILAHVPVLDQLVARYVRATSDPTALAMEKHACLRRLELELALGDRVQPSTSQRLLTLAKYQTHLLIAPHTPQEMMVLALAYASYAPRSAWPDWFELQGAQLWNDLRAAQVDAKADRRMSDVLSAPLDLVCDYAACALPASASTLVAVSPLSNVLDALRSEELLAFWTTLLASMMRQSDDASTALQPRVLDVVKDKASLLGLRKQLTTIAQERPLRNALAAQQLWVAYAVLALISGNVSGAKQTARMLVEATQVRTRATHLLLQLVLNEPGECPSPSGPIDALSSVVLGWMVLQRTWCASERVPVAELQQLASQCLWDAVAPSEPEAAVRSARPLSVTDHVRSVLGEVARRVSEHTATPAAVQLATRPWHRAGTEAHRVHIPSLTNSLDTLMDHLAGISAQAM